MEIVETTNHFFQAVYRVYDGVCLVAETFLRRDAEVIKAALEKDKEKREREESYYKSEW